MIITMMNSLFGNRNRIDDDGLADIDVVVRAHASSKIGNLIRSRDKALPTSPARRYIHQALHHEWKPQPPLPTMCHFATCH